MKLEGMVNGIAECVVRSVTQTDQFENQVIQKRRKLTLR